MVNILPSTELVDSWLKTISKQDDFYQLRKQAYNYYAQIVHQQTDKELARSLILALDWKKFTYTAELLKQQFQALSHGCWIADISDAIERCPWLVERIQHDIFGNSNLSPIGLLVAAIFMRCTVIYIPAGVTIREIIPVISEISAVSLAIEQVIIIIEPKSQVMLHDIQQLKSSCTYLRAVSLFIGADAQATIIHEQDGQNNISFSAHSYYLQQNASLSVVEGSTNRNLGALWIDYYLLQERAEVEHISVCALNEQEQLALITKQHHKSKNTKSSIVIKNVLQDQARAFYRGNITIDKQAAGSHANQQHTALMLSSDARACAIPSLEIETNDVRCQHGTAAGYLNQEQVWYLRSRGLEKRQAYKLIINGFFQEATKVGESSATLSRLIKQVQEHVRY